MNLNLSTPVRIAFTSLFAAVAVIGTASASTYIALTPSDTSAYENNAGQRINLKTSAGTTAGWIKYSDFLGTGEKWIGTTTGNEAVYVFNTTKNVSEKLIDFSASVGTKYNFSLGTCNTGGTIAQKGMSLTTPAGTFANVVRMTFTGTCADNGLTEAFFAPQAGVIKWSNSSFLGASSFQFTNGKIGGKLYGVTAPEAALKVNTSFGKTNFTLGASTQNASASIEVSNISAQDMVINFNSGQEFEISLIDANNQVLNNWSANVRFIQGMHKVIIPAGQSQSFGGVLALKNLNGQALKTGQYTLRIELTNAQIVANSTVLTAHTISANTNLNLVRNK